MVVRSLPRGVSAVDPVDAGADAGERDAEVVEYRVAVAPGQQRLAAGAALGRLLVHADAVTRGQ
ncbi:hypothetical protein GCM10027203_22310 [Nonomuraea fastidiosa]|jgi:hypothetical protein